MIVAALVALIAVQQAVLFLVLKTAAEERRRFLAAVMSKDPGEYVAVERATAPRPTKPKKTTAPKPHPHGL